MRADAVNRLVDGTRQGQASSLIMGDDGNPHVAAPSGSKDKRSTDTLLSRDWRHTSGAGV